MSQDVLVISLLTLTPRVYQTVEFEGRVHHISDTTFNLLGGISQNTHMYNHSLEGPTEFTEAIVFIVMVYHRKKIHIKINQGKRHMGQSLASFQMQMLPVSSEYVILPGLCENMHGVCLSREGHLSFGIAIFIRAPLHRHHWLLM